MWFFPHDFYGTVKCKWMDEFLCPSPKSDFYKAYLNNFNNPRAFSQFCLIPTILSNISRRKKSNLKIAFTWCMQKHAKIYISKIESWPNNIWWNSINFRLTELGPMWNEGWLTTQRSHRLVSLAVRRVTFAGAMSGGACRVWIFLDGWLGGLVPTMFTWRIRNLQQRKPDNCG